MSTTFHLHNRIIHILLVATAYIFFQIFAACLASMIVFSMYTQNIQKFDGDSIAITSIFATYLPSDSSDGLIFGSQYLGAFLLIMIIFILSKKIDRLKKPDRLRKTDLRVFALSIEFNSQFESGVSIGIISWLGSGVYFGWRTVFLLNPARDLAWGLLERFPCFNELGIDSRWWIPVVAPLIGSFSITVIYIAFMKFEKWCRKTHESSSMKKKCFDEEDIY
jgi:glycerol uptake facilitator-like aquaporin